MKPLFAVLALTGALFSGAAHAEYMYRYVNGSGNLVIDHTIPPEFVHKGYEILNPDGTVYKVIPRALTDEELANRSSEEYRKQVAAEEAERLRKWDESLLLRYSSVEDIEAARERALSELKIRISILKSNVRQLQRQVANNQARAADIERSGVVVPVEIIDAIDSLRGEISETERAIIEREREVELVTQGFNRDMERFTLLLDKVEMRRRKSVSSSR